MPPVITQGQYPGIDFQIPAGANMITMYANQAATLERNVDQLNKLREEMVDQFRKQNLPEEFVTQFTDRIDSTIKRMKKDGRAAGVPFNEPAEARPKFIIGIQIRPNEDDNEAPKVIVDKVKEGSPAEKAGL